MAHTPNPFDHSGTLDTGDHASPISEAFGVGTATVTDAGQPVPAARTVVTPADAASVCSALSQDAVQATVASARAAWITETTPLTRESLAQ